MQRDEKGELMVGVMSVERRPEASALEAEAGEMV